MCTIFASFSLSLCAPCEWKEQQQQQPRKYRIFFFGLFPCGYKTFYALLVYIQNCKRHYCDAVKRCSGSLYTIRVRISPGGIHRRQKKKTMRHKKEPKRLDRCRINEAKAAYTHTHSHTNERQNRERKKNGNEARRVTIHSSRNSSAKQKSINFRADDDDNGYDIPTYTDPQTQSLTTYTPRHTGHTHSNYKLRCSQNGDSPCLLCCVSFRCFPGAETAAMAVLVRQQLRAECLCVCVCLCVVTRVFPSIYRFSCS